MAADFIVDWTTRLLFVLFFIPSFQCRHARPSLYDDNDHVVGMNNTIFNRTVFGTDNAWMVEFYNSWCGFCWRMAPTYKQLADRVKGWKPVIRVAAIDCVPKHNLPVCRRYNISGYPSFKMIPPQSIPSSPAISLDKSFHTVEELIRVMLKFIDSWSDTRKAAHWPKFYPLQSTDNAWQGVGPSVKYFAIFVDKPNSLTGHQIILDLVAYKQVVIRRMLPRAVAKHGITGYPSLYLLNKNGTFRLLASNTTQSRFVKAVKNFLGVQPDDGTDKVAKPNSTAATSVDPSAPSVKGVHLQDMESALQHSLRHEVVLHSVIEGEKLQALKAYLRVLAKHFPGRVVVSNFLKKVSKWLEEQNQSITSAMWTNKINSLQTETAYLPTIRKWTGCRGSQPQYRGYPCGLWTLFHVLSVNAVLNMASDPQEMLLAMRGYISNFFGCTECVRNFMKSAVNIEAEVQTSGDSILWLWKAHNKANKFLKGDVSEDPQHPKIQFPAASVCPKCRNSNRGEDWNEQEVLKFLKDFYGKYNIVKDVVVSRGHKSGPAGKWVMLLILAILYSVLYV